MLPVADARLLVRLSRRGHNIEEIWWHHTDRATPRPPVRKGLSPVFGVIPTSTVTKEAEKSCVTSLIVFDRDIVVFSDKSCAYPDTDDEVKDWARWFRRSIRELGTASLWSRALDSQPSRPDLSRCRMQAPVSDEFASF